MLSELKDHPGYVGSFTTSEAAGALPNGTLIRKRNSEPDDATRDGVLGKVMGSLGTNGMPMPAHLAHIVHFYFVEWSDKPGVVIGCIDHKIELAEKIVG